MRPRYCHLTILRKELPTELTMLYWELDMPILRFIDFRERKYILINYMILQTIISVYCLYFLDLSIRKTTILWISRLAHKAGSKLCITSLNPHSFVIYPGTKYWQGNAKQKKPPPAGVPYGRWGTLVRLLRSVHVYWLLTPGF
jgi:hypothetical protein